MMSDDEVLIMAKRLAELHGMDEAHAQETLERAIRKGMLFDLDVLGITKADLAPFEILDVDRPFEQRRRAVLDAAEAVLRRAKELEG